MYNHADVRPLYLNQFDNCFIQTPKIIHNQFTIRRDIPNKYLPHLVLGLWLCILHPRLPYNLPLIHFTPSPTCIPINFTCIIQLLISFFYLEWMIRFILFSSRVFGWPVPQSVRPGRRSLVDQNLLVVSKLQKWMVYLKYQSRTDRTGRIGRLNGRYRVKHRDLLGVKLGCPCKGFLAITYGP